MKEQAVLLADSGTSTQNDRAAEVLRFFGVSSRVLSSVDFLAPKPIESADSSKARLICSSDTLLKLVEDAKRHPEGARWWQECVHSAFVYAGDSSGILQKLVRRITSDEHASLIQLEDGNDEWVVSNTLPQLCGAMSGVRVPIAKTDNTALVFDGSKGDVLHVISAGQKPAFIKSDYQRVPIFLSTAADIIDLNSELTERNFDIRNHFLSALPIVLYVKWAFAETCWQAPEINACVVIDDPLLKPQYGFLNYRGLLALMDRHNFSTNIAFIPWNWRRSSSKAVRLFKENPERYSLSVHGCDHTGGEFGTRDMNVLAWKAGQAMERMSRHESRTGIRHDRVMVFPQGVFSEPALGVLKQTHFTAAVNTEVISSDPHPSRVTISDVWDIAVTKYGSFAIFTRRYPTQGIENFAFDILLGKPCLVVIHHDFCRDKCARLVEFIKSLNALNCQLSWRSLGEVVRRSCRQRELSPGAVETEMYGSELRVENQSAQRKRFCIRKCEADPSAIQEIRTESLPVGWNSSNGHIDFEIDVNSGQNATISIEFRNQFGKVRSPENVRYKLKTMLRRYLSEARDNYVMRIAPLN